MANSVVECRQLRVTRGGAEVLHDLSFEVGAGVVTGLLGPSGCGKTTLIRAIAGTQLSTAGQLTVLGKPAGDPGLRRHVGYAAQTAAVYADLTVAENVRYFAAIVGAPDGDVERVLGAVELDTSRDRLVGRLSGGQRSRASLAVALLGTPRLLLLDEPTVGLDPVLREQLWALFAQLAGQGLSLLVSSHVMDEAARCDDLLLMREGELLTQDSPDGLLRRTGSANLDQAFLRLIRDTEPSAAPSSGRGVA
jgi:ABC-2 type transport system ATP-binding protein